MTHFVEQISAHEIKSSGCQQIIMKHDQVADKKHDGDILLKRDLDSSFIKNNFSLT